MACCPECGKQFVAPLGYSSILCTECLPNSPHGTADPSAAPVLTKSAVVIAGLGLITPALLGVAIHFWFLFNHLPVMEWSFFLERLPWFEPVMLLSDVPFLVVAVLGRRGLQEYESLKSYNSPTVICALAGGLVTEVLLFGSLWTASGHEMMDIVFFGGIILIPLFVGAGTGLGALVGWTAGACRKLVRPANRA